VALGKDAHKVIVAFCESVGLPVPDVPVQPAPDEVLFWSCDGDVPPFPVKAESPRQQHKRHTRKYAEGDLGAERSFYFRGPDGALNLRAQNLTVFLQMAEGIDDRTWTHHLQAGDYSGWFRNIVKDEALAEEAATVEADQTLDPGQSRKRITEAVTRRYTAPASSQKS
jgi:hypothetical protein